MNNISRIKTMRLSKCTPTRWYFCIHFLLTTSDKINDRTRSPHSLLVSWPNWYNAPKNFRNLLNSLDGSGSKIGVDACGMDAADDVWGGVVDPPFWIGDVLPFVVRCNGKLVYCTFGEIGDRGATARTLSGESGVRPVISKFQKLFYFLAKKKNLHHCQYIGIFDERRRKNHVKKWHFFFCFNPQSEYYS